MAEQTYALAANGVYGQANGVYQDALSTIPDSAIWHSNTDWDANQSESGVDHSGATLELATASGTAPDLHYSFSETSGDAITDETGNGYDGTLNGTADLGVSGIESTSGIEFNGNEGAHVAMGDIINEAAGTFTFWLKVTRHFDYNAIVDNDVDANDWEAWVDGDLQKINWRPGSTKLGGPDTDTSLSIDTWYHIGLTWEENNVAEVYIDANLEDSVSAPSSFDPATGMHIGQGNSGNDPTEAFYDEFRWYDQRLSGSEIQDDMDRGSSQTSESAYQTSGSLTTANGVI